MAKGIKELRRRIHSIQNTQKITSAMEMVSAAKLRRTQTLMEQTRLFTRKLETLLGRLSLSPTAAEHPLFQKGNEEAPPLLVLFTSDRGLCGAFNANLSKLAAKYLEQHPGSLLYAVGRKGRDHFNRRIRDRIVGSLVDLGGNVDGEVTDQLGAELLEYFTSGRVSVIDFVASEFVSTARQRPTVTRFLPLSADAFGVTEEEAAKAIDYILEPSPERVFDALLPRYLKNKVYLTLAESMTSEHAARMLAMNNATSNCEELTQKLTLQMNKARQTAITTEIIEVVSGANALSG